MEKTLSFLTKSNICHDKEMNFHSANICVVCDEFITGIDEINWIKISNLKRNSTKLSIQNFENNFDMKILLILRNQYKLEDDNDEHKDLLLSKRAKKCDKGYMICQSCNNSLTTNKNVRAPPRFSIANGFVIGHIPHEIITANDITELISAMIAPVRPFSYAISFSGGSLKSLKGHHTFFENNIDHMGSVMNNYLKTGANPNVYCIMCGRFTPKQRELAKLKSLLDTRAFMRLLDWFIKISGHPDFKNVNIPQNCPQPILIEDEATSNNIDIEIDPAKERRYEGTRYYFPSAYEPNSETGIFKS